VLVDKAGSYFETISPVTVKCIYETLDTGLWVWYTERIIGAYLIVVLRLRRMRYAWVKLRKLSQGQQGKRVQVRSNQHRQELE
jgi:hypothetical protein